MKGFIKGSYMGTKTNAECHTNNWSVSLIYIFIHFDETLVNAFVIITFRTHIHVLYFMMEMLLNKVLRLITNGYGHGKTGFAEDHERRSKSDFMI